MIATLLVALGLALDIVGLLVISWFAIRASDEDLSAHSEMALGGYTHPIAGLFRERKMLRIGIPTMVVGFTLQFAGVLLR